MTLSRADTLRLAAESLTDVRTVRAVYEGRPTRPTSRERVLSAARKLKIAGPDEPDVIAAFGRVARRKR